MHTLLGWSPSGFSVRATQVLMPEETDRLERLARYLTRAPVRIDAVYLFARPKGHYRANGELKPKAPTKHTKKPDLDKLDRALWDGMTGLVFVDDSQVCDGSHGKRYVEKGESPGADVTVTFDAKPLDEVSAA